MDQLLAQFGLTAEESLVYKTLLKLGGAKVSQIAKHLNFKRTSTQEYIRSLGEKGLINSTKFGNKYLYQSEDPDKFRQIINERQFVVDRLIHELKNKPPEVEWSVKSFTNEEAQAKIRKAKRKNEVSKTFGDTKVGGAVINKKIILWSENKEIPAIEIIAPEILELHQHIFK